MDNPFVLLEQSILGRISVVESGINEILSHLKTATITNPDNRRYVNKKSAALLADVSTSTIDNWGREGRISRYYFGGSVRFWLPELMEFLQAQKVA